MQPRRPKPAPRRITFEVMPTTVRVGALKVIGVVAAAFALWGPASASAAPLPGDPTPGDAPLLSDISSPSISASAGSMVFTATSPDGRRSIFHLDRSDGDLTDLVTVPDARRTGDTVAATLSDDGCVVFAITQIGFDIFRDDDNNQRWDVYRLVLPHCDGRPNDWQLISDTARGTARDDIDPEQRLSVSSDGTIVAFTVGEGPTSDGPNDDDRTGAVIVDVSEPIGAPQRTTIVPGRPADPPTRPFHYGGADQPALSADGERVAFRADFDPRTESWNEGAVEGGPAAAKVWVWDRGASGSESTSDPNDGADTTWLTPTPGQDIVDESEPVLSADGSTLAFVAPADGRVGCSDSCPAQVYRWILGTDTPPELISAQPWVGATDDDTEISRPSIPGDGDSRSPTVNANGTLIAFVTDATNLTIARPDRVGRPDDGAVMIWGTIAEPDGARQYLAPANRPLPASEAPDADAQDDSATSAPIPGDNAHPDLSATGAVVVFDSGGSGVASPGSGNAVPLDPANSAVDSVQISAVGRQLGVATNPTVADVAQLDFGAVQVGQQSAELYTSVRNLGPSSIRPSAVYTDADNFQVQGGTCQAEVIIAPGQSCTVRVIFAPTSGGDFSATLVVDDATGTVARTELSGQGGDPRLRIDPAGADLGQGPVGQVDSGTAVLTVTNVALDATQVGEFVIAGNHPDDFSISRDECTGAVLAPEQRCTLELSFSPTGSGYRSATVIARATTGDRAAAVVGGHANRIPVLDPADASAKPGATVQLTGSGFEPGTPVWAGIVGERGIFGPFPVDDDGTVTATVNLPTHRLDAAISVAIQGETTPVLAAPIAIDQQPTTAPSYLPGFGYG